MHKLTLASSCFWIKNVPQLARPDGMKYRKDNNKRQIYMYKNADYNMLTVTCRQ